jgi:hypothetical protein
MFMQRRVVKQVTLLLIVLALAFIGAANAETGGNNASSSADLKNQSYQSQGISVYTTDPSGSAVSGVDSTTIPRTIMPYSPAVNMTHPGYWTPVAPDGLFQELFDTLAEKRVWTLRDALAMVNCVDRSEAEVKKLFKISVIAYDPPLYSARQMTFITNYAPGDAEEFGRCFRLTGKVAVLGARGRKLVKVDQPVISEEVAGRALQNAFLKLDGDYFVIEQEGGPLQINADSNQNNAGIAFGQVGGPGSGTWGGFLGYTKNWADAATWPIRVPQFRIKTYKAIAGRRYVSKHERDAIAKRKADEKAERNAYLKQSLEDIKSQGGLESPKRKPDPRIIRNGGQSR